MAMAGYSSGLPVSYSEAEIDRRRVLGEKKPAAIPTRNTIRAPTALCLRNISVLHAGPYKRRWCAAARIFPYTIDGRAALAGVASGGVRWLLFAPYFYSKLLTCLLINTLD